MARKCRRFLSVLCFCLIVLICMSSLSRLQWDDYQSNWNEGDHYPYEMLWVGSSHIYRTIIPQLLFNDYGLETLSLSTSNQTSWHTYTTLSDFEDLEKMKLVVVDVYAFLRPYTYKEGFNHTLRTTNPELIPADELQKRYTVAATPIRQLSEINPEKYVRMLGETEMDFPLQYASSLFNSHSQYLRMTRKNFEPAGSRFIRCKNYDLSLQISPLSDPFEADPNPEAEFNAQCRSHLMDVIALCKSKNVPLLLTAIPYEVTPEARTVLAEIEQIAQENGVDYLSMETIYEEAMLDWETDFMDPGHTNHYGAQKVTDFFGWYLTETYGLTDRSADPAPDSPFLQYPNGHYTAEMVQNLYRDQYVTDYLQLLYEMDDSQLLLFVTGEDGGSSLDEYAVGLLAELGIEVPGDGRPFAQISSPSKIHAVSASETLLFSLDAHTFELDPAAGVIKADHQVVSADGGGCKLVLFDLCDHAAADSIRFVTGNESVAR